MSNRYLGGFITATFNPLAAQAPLYPTVIGESFGGGYYAGKISTTANGVATHYLIVAPKATGEAAGLQYGPQGTVTGATSVIDGPTNTTNLAARGDTYQAALFCKNLTIGGFTDWYMPALNELEVLYYFLKPDTTSNAAVGANPNAVSPEPINTNYTTGSPAQTSATAFRTGAASQEFSLPGYIQSSTETDLNNSYVIGFDNGLQYNTSKTNIGSRYVRAVRRIPV